MTKPLMEFDQLIVETDSSIELGIDTIRSRERTEVLSGTWDFTQSIPTLMSDPRMRVEALKRYMEVHPVNTSLDTRSSRENSTVAENSSESGIVERKKMKSNEIWPVEEESDRDFN